MVYCEDRAVVNYYNAKQHRYVRGPCLQHTVLTESFSHASLAGAQYTSVTPSEADWDFVLAILPALQAIATFTTCVEGGGYTVSGHEDGRQVTGATLFYKSLCKVLSQQPPLHFGCTLEVSLVAHMLLAAGGDAEV